jgi:hypothetical protein
MYQARATDSLLDAGFWDLLQKAHQVIVDTENKRGESQYWWLVASKCVRSSARTMDRHQLIDTLAGQPRELLVSLIDALADVSADLKTPKPPKSSGHGIFGFWKQSKDAVASHQGCRQAQRRPHGETWPCAWDLRHQKH